MIACSKDDFKTKFKRASRKGREFITDLMLKQMLKQNSVLYPHFSQFIQILLCTVPNTSPVEGGNTYSSNDSSKAKKPFLLIKH